MAFNLRSKSGATGKISDGHWAVFLILAQSYGWKPEGTLAPAGFSETETWSGRYDTCEGQTVTDTDAKQLGTVLYGAIISDTLPVALAEVIAHVEKLLEDSGIAIPEPMRMAPEHFHEEFNPMLEFLYDGEFVIE
jgi:hypothetical protein